MSDPNRKECSYSEKPNDSDSISRQAVIDALDQIFNMCEEIDNHLPEDDPGRSDYEMFPDYMTVRLYLNEQPEIIRCKDCKHWAKTCGDNQWSLGDCGLFEKHLVMCKGYCAWAERK